MSRSSLRKLAAAGLGAALIGSGLTVGLGAGVASADAECKATTTFTHEGIRVTQTVSPAEIYAGGEVTYNTKVSRASGVWGLAEIGIFHPAGFKIKPGPKLNVKYVVGGQKSGDVNLSNDVAKGLYWAKAGMANSWDMTGDAYAELTTKFTVPAEAASDSTHVAGVQAKPLGWNTSQEWPTGGACVTIRGKSPIESAAGSLDDIGLGSVNAGSSNIFGSATDPAGSVGNIVDGLDFGKILGDMLKSAS